MELPHNNLQLSPGAICGTNNLASRTPGPWDVQTVVVRDIRPELSDVATYDLEFTNPEFAGRYELQPGQFNMLYVPGIGDAAISVSDDPTRIQRDGRVRHTIRNVGRVTGAIAKMEIGDSLGLRGPFGQPWPMEECVGRDVILVAGGLGLAPLRPVIYSLLAQRETFGRLHLLYGTRSPDTLVFEEQYEAWNAQGLIVQSTVDRATPEWRGHVGVVTTLLDTLFEFDPDNTTVFSCGPEIMMKFTMLTALERGIPVERLWLSMERNMQCAVGFCGHCQLGPAFVCKDGPVFRYDYISQFMNIGGL